MDTVRMIRVVIDKVDRQHIILQKYLIKEKQDLTWDGDVEHLHKGLQ